MANEKNLKPARTKTEARERGAKGGKRSGEVRRERKTIREILLQELGKEVAGGMTAAEYLVAKAIKNHAGGKLTFQDLDKLQNLLGESILNVNVKGEGLKIEVSPEIAKAMAEDAKK